MPLQGMGGIGFTIEITPQADAGDPQSLLDEVWEAIEHNIYHHNGGRPETRTILNDSDYMAYQPENWQATETELFFSFRDMAGCCHLSMDAYYHWATLATANLSSVGYLQEICQSHGYKLKDDEWCVPRQVWRPGDVFCALPGPEGKTELYGIYCYDGEFGLNSDEGLHLEFSELPETEQTRLRALVLTGDCQCATCVELKDEQIDPISPDQYPLIPTALACLRSEQGTALARAASHKLRAANSSWSKPLSDELLVLHDYLEEQGAAISNRSLIGLLLNDRSLAALAA
jgi:hypothetical protein